MIVGITRIRNEALILNAILFAVGHIYEVRSSVNIGNITSEVPMTFEHMLWPYRLSGL